jgi:hypothetical protein
VEGERWENYKRLLVYSYRATAACPEVTKGLCKIGDRCWSWIAASDSYSVFRKGYSYDWDSKNADPTTWPIRRDRPAEDAPRNRLPGLLAPQLGNLDRIARVLIAGEERRRGLSRIERSRDLKRALHTFAIQLHAGHRPGLETVAAHHETLRRRRDLHPLSIDALMSKHQLSSPSRMGDPH